MGRYLPNNVDTTKASTQLKNAIENLTRQLLKYGGTDYNPLQYGGGSLVCLSGIGVARTLQDPNNPGRVYDVSFKDQEVVDYVRESVKDSIPTLKVLNESTDELMVVHEPVNNQIFRMKIDSAHNELDLIEEYTFYHEHITYNRLFGFSIGNDDGVYEAIARKELRLNADSQIPPLTTLYRAIDYLEEGYSFHKPSVNTLMVAVSTTSEDPETGEVRERTPDDDANINENLNNIIRTLNKRKELTAETLDDGIESYPVVGIDGRLKENYMR